MGQTEIPDQNYQVQYFKQGRVAVVLPGFTRGELGPEAKGGATPNPRRGEELTRRSQNT